MNKQKIATQISVRHLNDESFGYYLRMLRESRTDIVLISVCEFYHEGKVREEVLGRLKEFIARFRAEGYDPIVWTSSLGYCGDRDEYFKTRFKNSHRLTDSTGRTEDVVCPYDEDFSDVMADNVRDFIRAGAKTILWDDDLLQSCRPGAFCCCSEHLGRLNKILNSDYKPADIPSLFVGKPSRERSAFLDVSGEGLYGFCRKMRKAADEIDETVNMGLCASFTHYDCEGVDMNRVIDILSGKGSRPLFRLSGAPYWTFIAGRFQGQSLPDVIEFVRMQYSWYKGKNYTLMDENDSYPRDPAVIPPYSCELYDKATLTMPELIRHKYFMCYKHDEPVEDYVRLHIKNLERDEALTEMFSDAEPLGVGIFEAERKIKDADLYDTYPGNGKYMSDFSQPLGGLFFSRFGFATKYTDDDFTVAFGENARHIPDSKLSDGLILDLTAAKILEEKGIDTGIRSNENSGFSYIYRNSRGQIFGVVNLSIYDVSFNAHGDDYASIFNEENRDALLDMLRTIRGKDIIPYVGLNESYIIASEKVADGSVSVLLLNDSTESLNNIRVKNAGDSRILFTCEKLPSQDFSAANVPAHG